MDATAFTQQCQQVTETIKTFSKSYILNLVKHNFKKSQKAQDLISYLRVGEFIEYLFKIKFIDSTYKEIPIIEKHQTFFFFF